MAEIDLRNVNLTFRIRQTRNVTLKEFLLKRLFLSSVNPVVEVRALQNINVHLEQGMRLGVIGHNGAGKSTLLKLMAGIYPPTSGTRRVKGSICSLFDIALGFELEASGWENIRYRAFLQGETPRTLAKKVDAIAEFCELGDFLNVPVRFYSAGMMIRLAFSIASAVEPEILLIDEVLGVGDAAFYLKARARMEELMRNARLMVMISHDIGSIRSICDLGLWMDHGRMMKFGPVNEVADAYEASVAPPKPVLQAA
jgi:ABC-type polysaccharide/polyol phosphate transport system ATPase subunit